MIEKSKQTVIRKAKNKDKKVVPATEGKERDFYFPATGITVRAKSLKEAIEKHKALT